MIDQKKLDSGDKHILRLIKRDAGADGWAKTSRQVMPIVLKLPPELVDVEKDDETGGGRVRLTPEGEAVALAMDWI